MLSEIPAEWADRVQLWRRLNAAAQATVAGPALPDPAHGPPLFQAHGRHLAARAAGRRRPRDASRAGRRLHGEGGARGEAPHQLDRSRRELRGGACGPTSRPCSRRTARLGFLDELERFVARIARAGLWNALGRTVLHLASPGVPDLYQGDELWSFALVDPDNRRPVDFERRAADCWRRWSAGTAGGDGRRRAFLRELVASPEDGRLKLHVIRAALAARRTVRRAFRSAHLPSRSRRPAIGRPRGGLRARGRDERLVAVVPRFRAGHVLERRAPTDPALWAATGLPLPAGWPSRWSCALSGRSLQAEPDATGCRSAELFGILPVALLLAEPSPERGARMRLAPVPPGARGPRCGDEDAAA